MKSPFKTIIDDVLKYQGPVFSSLANNMLSQQGIYLLEVRQKYCRKCGKTTSQEWVRNRDFHYWRCSECLERHIKTIDIGTPSNYCNKVSNNLELLK